MTREDGVRHIRPRDLAEVSFVDEHKDRTVYRSSLFYPTYEEICEELERYDLPVEHSMKIIQERDAYTHTILFEVARYKEHLREQGLLPKE